MEATVTTGAKAGSVSPGATDAARRAEAIGKAKRMAGAMANYFEKNQGQTDPSVKYLSRSGRYSMYLTDDATTVISMVGGQIHKGTALAMSNQPARPDEDRLGEAHERMRRRRRDTAPRVA